ncbi:MAG: ATP-binding protein [Myxococcota bacterium]
MSRVRQAIPVVIVLAGLLTTATLAGFDYRAEMAARQQEAKDAVSVAADQASFLLETLQLSVDLVAREIESGSDEDALNGRLAEIRSFLPLLHTLLVLDAEGVIQADLRPKRPAIGLDVSDRGYFESALTSSTSRLLLGVPVVSRVDGRIALPMSRPVRGPEGALLGVVVASVNAGFFDFVWRDVPGERWLDLSILSPELGVTALLRPEIEDSEHRASVLEAWAHLQDDGVVEPAGLRSSIDADMLTIASPLPGHARLFVLGLSPTAELSARARDKMMPRLALGILLSVLLGLSVRVFMRRSDQLLSSRKLIAETAAGIPGAIVRLEQSSEGQSLVDYVSPACVDLWELSPKTIRARPESMFGPSGCETAKQVRATMRAAVESGKVWSHRWRVATPSGKFKCLDGVGRPERLAGGRVRWVMVILDVTKQVEIAEDLQQSREIAHRAQKMESIGQLTGGIAHDFNNLLTIILSGLELIRESSRDDAELLGLIDGCVQATLRGSDLTRSMLIFAGRSKLAPRPVDLNRIARETRAWAARALPSHTDIEVRLDPDLDLISADPSSLESVLLNLMINARDAMPHGGRLTITTSNRRLQGQLPRIRVGELASGPHVCLTVEDTGTGIDAEHLDRVFEPFFTTKAPGSGTGLGLAMIAGAVEESGGAIAVESLPGTGSRFELLFPALQGELVGTESGPGPQVEATRGARILLVEDVDAVRALLSQTLTDAGYRVRTASSGDEARSLFEAHPSDDVLLTDVVMPGRLDGSMLAQSLRALRPDLPVVFLSGYSGNGAMEDFEFRPGDAHLSKPVSREDLLAAIEGALGHAPERPC